MSCERFEQVHAYHDDAIAASDRLAVESHMKTCADCRELLADLRGLSNLFAAAPLTPMSAEAVDRLAKSWRTARDRGLLRITSWLTAAAAAVLIGALLLFPAGNEPANTTIATTAGAVGAAAPDAAWETLAVMPPLETDENLPEIVALATWMANDLSVSDLSNGERQ